MADLKKWFPFRFNRTRKETPAPEATAASPAVRPPDPVYLFPGLSPGLQRLMDQMMGAPFLSRPGALLEEFNRFFGDFAPASFSPHVDVVDEGQHVKVEAELPGLAREDIELSVHEGSLTIRGEKKQEQSSEEEGCYRTERYFGAFERTIPLPIDIDLGGSEAKFDKGVLTVRFPKSEPAVERRRIPVG